MVHSNSQCGYEWAQPVQHRTNLLLISQYAPRLEEFYLLPVIDRNIKMLLLTEIHLQSLAFPASRALMRSWSRLRLISTQITIKRMKRKINCVRFQSFGLGTILWVADNYNYWVITAALDGNFPRSDQRSSLSFGTLLLGGNQELF